MAKDNMIELVATLDTDASIDQINSDISKKLNGNFNLQIKCEVDTSEISKLRDELKSISKNLKITIDSKTISSSVSRQTKVKDEAAALSKAMNLKFKKDQKEEAQAQIRELIGEYKKFAEAGDFAGQEETLGKLASYMAQYEQQIKNVNTELLEQQRILKKALQVPAKEQVVNVKDIYDDLVADYGKSQADAKLTELFGGKNRWTLTPKKSTTDFDKLVGDINGRIEPELFENGALFGDGRFSSRAKGVTQLLDAISESVIKADKAFTDTYAEDIYVERLERLREALNQILNIQAKQPDNGLVDLGDMNEMNLEVVASDVEKIKEATKEIHDTGEVEIFDMNDIDYAEKKVEDIKRTLKDISIPAGGDTKSTLGTAKTMLNEFYGGEEIEGNANRIKRAIEDTEGELQRFYVQVERGDKSVETLTFALNEQGDAYEFLSKTIREADNSTDFRRKDIGVQWDIQTEKLKQFISNAEKAGVSSTVLGEDIKKLTEKLALKGDTNAMNAFLDDFDIAKAKLQAFNAEARKENATSALDRRIQKLTSDVRTYAETNERAVKSTKLMTNGVSFADAWRGIEQLAQKANLSDQEVKQLATAMSIFRREAQAAGLAGESAFGKFLNSFKLMSSYITANMVFNFVKRQIRDMVNEVTALDTAMVELRKVTEATEEDFRKFQKSAGNTAKELGASITDVINATSTFARLGESLPDAEELGKVAILYQNVGDGITETQAAEDLVSTMKAFNIEAKDSISIVDKFNEVGKILLPQRNYIG